MGADTVDYHRDTVLGRADDHPGQALDYYASRGETPLRWAGAVATRLGLAGEVTAEQYEAVFGPGGCRDPLSGERLVCAMRPGFELVVAAHKTVALLGVVGRADDMHAILDVETGATLGHLEGSMQDSGGRRGRAATVTPTSGLLCAVTRHGTSRAGDPSPHDHALIANVTEMRDARGGFKALFSALLRDRVEAATMVGRLCSAAEAVRRGYAIERDDGPSGRLRHWRITGIAQEACDKLSKRSDAIDEYLAERGFVGYRARNAAARATRVVKRGTGVDELQPRWEAELAEIGWPIERLHQALEVASAEWTGLAPPLSDRELDRLTERLMDPDGEFLARGKIFTRTRVVGEVAPELYGHDPTELDHVVDQIVASPLVVPLIGVEGVRERVYTAAEVLATEQAIAACVDRLIQAPGPRLDPTLVLAAIAAKQDEIGAELSDGQYRAVNAVCVSGRAVDVIVGVAGSGKTTALDAAATALETAGYTVIGTATSGQAARSLAHADGIEARTMRSLLWHLDHRTIALDGRSVMILDEAGMTADADMARLLLAVEAAGAKVVIVGDDRQLSAVGPGGALHQVLADHPETVTVLGENLRQRDPAEREALLALRSGDLDAALAYYLGEDRITVGSDRTQALAGMVEAWAADTQAGHDTFLLAWQRSNVEALNRLARDQARTLGWLTGPDMHTSEGRYFAVGDLVVTLAPNYRGQLVTSERARVVAVDPDAQSLTVETDHGRPVTLLGSELDPDRLDYGYALTVHREQGATSDRTHYYADGGGRELAYVAMSRARHRSAVHVVADDVDQAVEQLTDDWSRLQADTWLTPTTQVGDDPRHEPASVEVRAERARIQLELEQLHALTPPDVTSDLDATLAQLDTLKAQREHLLAGTGPYHHTPAGRVIRDLRDLDHDLAHANHRLAQARPWERRRWHRLIDTYQNYQAHRIQDWGLHGQPEAQRLDAAVDTTQRRMAELHSDDQFTRQWHSEHPEHTERVRQLQRTLELLDTDQTLAAENIQDTSRPADSTASDDLDREATDRPSEVDRVLHLLKRPTPEAPEPEPPTVGGLEL
jgi:conjugative relaxase-like TrwC/TraI family protein